nr:unnamed protein product [Callosobruchus analis]
MESIVSCISIPSTASTFSKCSQIDHHFQSPASFAPPPPRTPPRRRDSTMFDTCQTLTAAPKCTEVAEKLTQLFGWRQTYNVEKLQRHVAGRSTTRISITRPSPTRERLGKDEKVRLT